MNPRRAALRATESLTPRETTNLDRIASLRAERAQLALYNWRGGLTALQKRIVEIDAAIQRLKEVP